MRILPDGTVEIKNTATGETKIVKPQELGQYNPDLVAEYVTYQTGQNKITGGGEANENTQEAIAAMQEAVSGALQADPKANKRGLYYKWIRANEPTFKGLGIDSAALWGVHETTPEQTIEQQDMATVEQQQNQGAGLIQRLTG